MVLIRTSGMGQLKHGSHQTSRGLWVSTKWLMPDVQWTPKANSNEHCCKQFSIEYHFGVILYKPGLESEACICTFAFTSMPLCPSITSCAHHHVTWLAPAFVYTVHAGMCLGNYLACLQRGLHPEWINVLSACEFSKPLPSPSLQWPPLSLSWNPSMDLENS